ncbi:hypothetical protein [Ammoniphilus sp. 3BR4]|uniref:hypothetical protein n=1 Tax=Ammoniphilus sp. 3BR4 TaxID=3158265 RepID=UPI00346577A8
MDQVFQTGDKAPEDGMYICEKNGLEKSFHEGETFDTCPVSWENTTWRKKPENA